MGLFGSLIKSGVKLANLPVALGLDIVTSGGRMALSEDGNTFTENAYSSLKKEIKKVSKGLDKL